MTLNLDERAVVGVARSVLYDRPKRMLDAVRDGLERGRDAYGPLDIANDERDFIAEAGQEFRDAIVYIGCAIVKRRSKGEDVAWLYMALELAAKTWWIVRGRV